jgi:putative sigma-54 modulation protein
MNINITARRFKTRDSYKTQIHEKMEKLKRFYDGVLKCDVVLDHRDKIQIAEFRLRVHKKTLIATHESDLMLKSIDLAIDDLEGQLKKYKNKMRAFEHKKITDKEPIPIQQEDADEADDF